MLTISVKNSHLFTVPDLTDRQNAVSVTEQTFTINSSASQAGHTAASNIENAWPNTTSTPKQRSAKQRI